MKCKYLCANSNENETQKMNKTNKSFLAAKNKNKSTDDNDEWERMTKCLMKHRIVREVVILST